MPGLEGGWCGASFVPVPGPGGLQSHGWASALLLVMSGVQMVAAGQLLKQQSRWRPTESSG